MPTEPKAAQAPTEAAPKATPEQTDSSKPAVESPVVEGKQETEQPKDAKPGDTGTQEPPKAADPAPKDVELKLPEGVQVDEAFLAKAKEAFKAQGMSAAQQQAVVDTYAAHVAEANKAFEAQQQQQRAAWREQIKNDPELGGAKFDATLSTVAKAVDRFFGEEGRKLFDTTGLGDHPLILRALHKIGSRISEDSIAGTTGVKGSATNTLAAIYDHPTSRAQLK